MRARFRERLRRFENAFLDEVRLDVLGHVNQEASHHERCAQWKSWRFAGLAPERGVGT